ncbi:hypothetical protein BKA70DRAFT_1236725 [Coprinopsis sp. MPI-PUGE-AT-0042]|nr:hypothetical protein BKA70DRAFT_1236725 [Coprinopsis sp. MPI-PUGE-AT-0042]
MKHRPYGTTNSQGGSVGTETVSTAHFMLSGVPAPTIQHSQMASSTLCPICKELHMKHSPYGTANSQGGFRGPLKQWSTAHFMLSGVPATHHPNIPRWPAALCVQFCKELHMKHSPYGTANSQGGSCCRELHMKHRPYGTTNSQGGPWALNSVHCTFHAQWGYLHPPSNIPRWPAALCVQFCKELHMKHSPYGTANSQGGSVGTKTASHATFMHWWNILSPTFTLWTVLQGASYEAQAWGYLHQPSNIPRWPAALCVQFCKELHMKHSPYGTANSQGGSVGTETVSTAHFMLSGVPAPTIQHSQMASSTLCPILQGASYEAQPVWHCQQSGWFRGHSNSVPRDIHASVEHPEPKHSLCGQCCRELHMKHRPYGTTNSQGGSVGTETVSTAHFMLSGVPAPTIQHSQMASSTLCPILQGASYEAQPVWHRQQSGWFLGYLHQPSNIPRWPAALCVQFCKELHMKHSPYGTANSQGGSWGTCTHHPTFPDGQQQQCCRELHMKHSPYGTAKSQGGSVGTETVSTAQFMLSGVPAPTIQHSQMASSTLCPILQGASYEAQPVWHRQQSGWFLGYLHPPSNIPRWPAALCVQFCKELHMKHSPYGTANSQGGSVGTKTASHATFMHWELHMKHRPYGTTNSQGGSVGTETVSTAHFMLSGVPAPTIQHSQMASSTLCPILQGASYEAQPVWHRQQSGWFLGYLHQPSNIPRWPAALCVQFCKELHMKHSPYGTANSQGGSVGTKTASHATFMHRELHMKHSPYGTANSQGGSVGTKRASHATFMHWELHMKHRPYGTTNSQGGSVGTETVSTAHFMLSGVPAPTIQHSQMASSTLCPILQGASYEAQPVWHRQQSGWFLGYLHPPSNIPRWPAALCVQFCKELHMKHSPYGTANSQGGSWGTCTHHPTFPDGQQQQCCRELHMKHSPYGTAKSQGGSVGTETVSTAQFMLSGVPAPTIQHSQMASSTLCPILQGASYEAQPVWHRQDSVCFHVHSIIVQCMIHASVQHPGPRHSLCVQLSRDLHLKHSPYGTAKGQGGAVGTETVSIAHLMLTGVSAPTIQHSQMARSTLCPILQGASYEAQPMWQCQESGWAVGSDTVLFSHFMPSAVPAPTIQHSQMARK